MQVGATHFEVISTTDGPILTVTRTSFTAIGWLLVILGVIFLVMFNLLAMEPFLMFVSIMLTPMFLALIRGFGATTLASSGFGHRHAKLVNWLSTIFKSHRKVVHLVDFDRIFTDYTYSVNEEGGHTNEVVWVILANYSGDQVKFPFRSEVRLREFIDLVQSAANLEFG